MSAACSLDAPKKPVVGPIKRELWTQYGCIFDLCVPKLRRGNRLQEAMHLTLGEVLSLEACNRLVLGLEERAHAFKTARLEHPPPIVLVDGLWLKLAVRTGAVKSDRLGRQRPVKHKEKRVMLTALGIWDDGHWEILTWQLAPGEDAVSWGAFLRTLYSKGITEETTQLIVSDGAQGLEKTLSSHFWGVPHQRCIFHKSKNIADHLQYTELMTDAHETSSTPSRQVKQEHKQAILAEVVYGIFREFFYLNFGYFLKPAISRRYKTSMLSGIYFAKKVIHNPDRTGT
jgi:hypothetical protein